jgi:ACR3 family arsenite transporter
VLYVVLPLAAGVITRYSLEKNKNTNSTAQIQHFMTKCKPWSVVGLLATVVLLFGFQANTIFTQPLAIVFIAIPLLIQTFGVFAITFIAAKAIKLPYSIAAPACMIGASNFFELAVAVAISLFGLHSGAALATVVGVLVEVPVMLALVAFCNRTQHWFDQH